jgi:hypothetical protein
MGVLLGTERHVAAIMNAAWMVRHYARGAGLRETNPAFKLRADAIYKLGMICREAFNEAEDFEPLLSAIIDALSKQPPSF